MLQNFVLQNLMVQNSKKISVFMSVSPHTSNRCILISKWSAEVCPQYMLALQQSFSALHVYIWFWQNRRKQQLKRSFILLGGKKRKQSMKSSDVTELWIMIMFSNGFSISIRNLHLITLHPKRRCAVMNTVINDSVE